MKLTRLEAGVASGDIRKFLLCRAPDGMQPQFLFLWPESHSKGTRLLCADDGSPLGFTSIDEVVELLHRLGSDQANLSYYPGNWSLDDLLPVIH